MILERINHLTENKEQKDSNQESYTNVTLDTLGLHFDEYDPIEAQNKFLKQYPPYYVILGKPGIGQNDIGKRLAEDRGCIYIDPETLVQEEIEKNTKLGLLLEYSVRLDRTIHSDVVTKLLECRLRSPEVNHLGFVLAGFPMIPQQEVSDAGKAMITESTVFTVEQTLHELLETSIINSAIHKKAEMLLKKKIAEESARIEPGEDGPLGSEDKVGKANKAEEAIGEGSPEMKKPPSVEMIPEATDFNPATLYTRLASECNISMTHSLAEKAIDPENDIIIQLNTALMFCKNNTRTVLIYITCPDDDVIIKRISSDEARNDTWIDEQTETDSSTSSEMNFDQTYNTEDENYEGEETQYEVQHVVTPEETVSAKPSNGALETYKQPKYTIFPQRNDPESIRLQINLYKKYALPMIEDSMLLRDPQCIIRLDGRCNKNVIFEAIRARLISLGIPYAFVVTRFFPPEGKQEGLDKNDERLTGEGNEEEPEQQGDEEEQDIFEGKTPQECLQLLTRMQRISPLYRWNTSDWGPICPVSLKEGRSLIGKPKFAVKFLDQIFMLSSEESLSKFTKNPRPYLMHPMPRAVGRIFLMGPPGVGKSLIGTLLGYFLNAKVIKVDNISEEYRRNKIARILFEKYPEAFQRAQEIILAEKVRQWENSEKERIAEADAYKAEISERVRQLLRIKKFIGDCENPDVCDCTCTCGKKSGCTCYDLSDITYTVEEIEDYLLDKNLYAVTFDFMLCLKIRADSSILNEYLPDHLRISPEKPTEIPFNDEEVVNIVISGLSDPSQIDEIQIEEEDLAPMYTEAIQSVDKQAQVESNGKYKYGAYILDSVNWNEKCFHELADADMLPDDIIVIQEEDQMYPFTLTKFERNKISRFREFKDLFKSLNEPEAMARSPSVHTTLSMMYEDIYESIERIIDGASFEHSTIQEQIVVKESVIKFRENFYSLIDKYRKEHAEMMDQVEDLGIEPIIINISDPSETKLMKKVIKELILKYTERAQDYTPEDVKAELQDIAQEYKKNVDKNEIYGEDIAQDTDEEYGEDDDDTTMKLSEHRRLGDTAFFCPVVLHEHKVLWRGKQQFLARYQGKIYMMSSEESKQKFLARPEIYATNKKAPTKPLPLRVVVTGTVGSARNHIKKEIAHNFGYHNVDYIEQINDIFMPTPRIGRRYIKWFKEPEYVEEEPDATYNMIQDYLTGKLNEEEADTFTRKCFDPLWHYPPLSTSTGLVLAANLNGLMTKQMIRRYDVPDVVVESSVYDLNKENLDYVESFKAFMSKWKKGKGKKIEERRKQNEESYITWLEQRDKKFDEEFFRLRSQHYREYLALRDRLYNHPHEVIEEQSYESFGNHYEDEIFPDPPLPSLTESQPRVDATEDVISRSSNDILISYPLDMSYLQGGDSISQYEGSDIFIWDDIEQDVKNIYAKLDAAEPMPEFIDEIDPAWETEEEARERIGNMFEEWFNEENAGIAEAREIMEEAGIPWMKLISSVKAQKSNIVNDFLHRLEDFKFRNKSIFEKTYVIPMDKVELLLRQGYYFLSRFGRTCPVQLYENVNPIQMYFPLLYKNETHAVAHRQYIYFINGSKNLEKFRRQPLEYIDANNLCRPLYPIKFAVIGPPKCGKTTLCRRFEHEFAIEVISKPQALNYVLTEMPWSKLASKVKFQLGTKRVVDSETTMKCVMAQTMTKKSLTQGFILDGFPNKIEELQELVSGDVIPYFIINLSVNLNTVLERNIQCACDTITCDYDGWCMEHCSLRLYLNEEFQNLYSIDGNRSKWDVWTEARDKLFQVMQSIHNYCLKIALDMPVKLEYMCITSQEFEQRQSTYREFCPVCYGTNCRLNSGGNPPNQTGLIQYLDKYYWLCKEHIEKFLATPKYYTPPYNITLSNELPVQVNLEEEDDALKKKIYASGYDMVTLIKSQPNSIQVMGNPKYAAKYMDGLYLFENEENLKTFMNEPDKYAENFINFLPKKPLPPLDLQKLPNLGYLQQTQTEIIIKALHAVGKLKPKCPGLDSAKSASVYMALYFKINNPKATNESKKKYKECETIFFERCKWLKDTIKLFKNSINPYIKLPKYLLIQQEEDDRKQHRFKLIQDELKYDTIEKRRKRAEDLLKDLKIKYTPIIKFGVD